MPKLSGDNSGNMSNGDTQALRKQLKIAMQGGESHITFAKVMEDFPPEARGMKPEGVPHSAWELLEHMRIAQWDILEFSRDPHHKSPKFPDGYWPQSDEPADEAAWNESVRRFEQDAGVLADLIENADLFTPFPHAQGQTLLREAVVVANHNSYHLGQLVFLKRMLAE